MGEMKGAGEPAIGVPYPAAPQPVHHQQHQQQPPQPMYYQRQQQQQQAPPLPRYYYVAQNPYHAGMVPPNAIYGDPKGIPLQQTMFRDTPAPFSCPYCGSSGLTDIKSKPSLAAFVGCMMPFMLGVCFLCPCMDCLWHKYHYCPNCGQKVANFEKSDPCIVMDPPHWVEPSYALPA